MSTVAVYNGFGQYETKDGEKGLTLSYAGLPFWFPFEKVAYLPDFLLREVDYDKSIADNGEACDMVFKNVRVSGQRLAEEMLETQIPIPNSMKGLILVTGKKGTFLVAIPAGWDELGNPLTAETFEIFPTDEEKQRAASLARTYKEQIIQEYFQSKRERMAGGHGQIFPTGMVRIFMNELGVKDIDDVTKQTTQTINVGELAALLRPAPIAEPKPANASDLV